MQVIFDIVSIFITVNHFQFLVSLIFNIADYFWYRINVYHCGPFSIFGAINIQHCGSFSILGAINIHHCRLLLISIFVGHFRFLVPLIFIVANYFWYHINIHYCGPFSIFDSASIFTIVDHSRFWVSLIFIIADYF